MLLLIKGPGFLCLAQCPLCFAVMGSYCCGSRGKEAVLAFSARFKFKLKDPVTFLLVQAGFPKPSRERLGYFGCLNQDPELFLAPLCAPEIHTSLKR